MANVQALSSEPVLRKEGETVPVAHMCGHDMHVTWLAGAAKLMAEAKTSWQGTLMTLFQPAEETSEGAQAMIDDGLFETGRDPGPACHGKPFRHGRWPRRCDHVDRGQPADPAIRARGARFDAPR
jgi:metal-dependent amidase/aminoacylase/carboxypeptidase family protein